MKRPAPNSHATGFEYADGKAVPMHLQSTSYRGLCQNSGNLDGDAELECSADVQPPAPPAPAEQPAGSKGNSYCTKLFYECSRANGGRNLQNLLGCIKKKAECNNVVKA